MGFDTIGTTLKFYLMEFI